MDPVAEYPWLHFIAAMCFGIVVGWVTYRTLRHSTVSGLSDIATVIGAVGGAAVTSLFPTKSLSFSGYCLGLFFGFFLYFLTARDPQAPQWMGGARPDRPADGPRPGGPAV